MRETQLEKQVERERQYNDLKPDLGRIIRVYIDEQKNKKYIDISAAFELGLITYEEFISNLKGLYPVTDVMILEWERQGYKIEYKYINPLTKTNENRIPIKIFIDFENGKRYITRSIAYYLGLISYDKWNFNKDDLYEVTDEMILEWERQGYKIELASIRTINYYKINNKPNEKFIVNEIDLVKYEQLITQFGEKQTNKIDFDQYDDDLLNNIKKKI